MNNNIFVVSEEERILTQKLQEFQLASKKDKRTQGLTRKELRLQDFFYYFSFSLSISYINLFVKQK